MIILVTSGSKGGTGKSTIALGLSAIFSLRGFRHELFDYSCSLGVCTGIVYYLDEYVNDINRLSRLVRVRQGLPSQDYDGLAIVDLPPMNLTQPEFVDLLGRADALVVVSSYEPDSVVSMERVLEAYSGSRIVKVCNRVSMEGCRHYLKVTPESPFFIVGEPTNFRTFLRLTDDLGFTGEDRFERVSREFRADGVKAKLVYRWDPYAIIGVEASLKWYYALMPYTKPIEELVTIAKNLLGPSYLNRLGFADNALNKLFRVVRH